MTHQNDVVTRGRQRSVSLVGDADRMQQAPAIELQRTGRSRNCVSTVPTDPAAFLIAAWPRAAISEVELDSDAGLTHGHSHATDHDKGDLSWLATVNNGVNVGASGRARGTERRAAGGKFTWRATCKWKNGTHSRTDIQGFYRARPGAEAQDRILVRGRSSGDIRVGGSGVTPD